MRPNVRLSIKACPYIFICLTETTLPLVTRMFGQGLVAEVKKAIREKVLDSYRNGLKAKATRERKDWR